MFLKEAELREGKRPALDDFAAGPAQSHSHKRLSVPFLLSQFQLDGLLAAIYSLRVGLVLVSSSSFKTLV